MLMWKDKIAVEPGSESTRFISNSAHLPLGVGKGADLRQAGPEEGQLTAKRPHVKIM